MSANKHTDKEIIADLVAALEFIQSETRKFVDCELCEEDFTRIIMNRILSEIAKARGEEVANG